MPKRDISSCLRAVLLLLHPRSPRGARTVPREQVLGFLFNLYGESVQGKTLLFGETCRVEETFLHLNYSSFNPYYRNLHHQQVGSS